MSARLNGPVTVPAILQLLTLGTLFTGGYVGKEAYDDLADRLTEARIEAAELRKVVEAQADLRVSADIEVNGLRTRLETVDLRLTALEVQQAQKKDRR